VKRAHHLGIKQLQIARNSLPITIDKHCFVANANLGLQKVVRMVYLNIVKRDEDLFRAPR